LSKYSTRFIPSSGSDIQEEVLTYRKPRLGANPSINILGGFIRIVVSGFPYEISLTGTFVSTGFSRKTDTIGKVDCLESRNIWSVASRSIGMPPAIRNIYRIMWSQFAESDSFATKLISWTRLAAFH
jgi:hypothetical protein